MKKILFTITIVSVLLSNCKKKEENPNTTTSSSNIDPNTFVGVFITGTYTSNLAGSTSQFFRVTSRFYSQPSFNIYQANEITLGAVKVNNDTLTHFGVTGYQLMTPTTMTNLSIDTWSVTGGNGIQSFNHTNNNSFPNCSNFNVLPDSVSKTSGYTFTINNISNMTWGVVSFGDGVSNAFTYTLSSGSNTINITSGQLSAMATGTLGSINIQMQNAVTATASGQNFRFIKEAQILKRLKINP